MLPRPWPLQDHILSGRDPASTRPVVRLLDLVLCEGVRAGAHTIEFRQANDAGLVLWDEDGALKPIMQLPAEAHTMVVGRLKALLGHAPGSPGPFEGELAFASDGTAAHLAIRAATHEDGGQGAIIHVLSVSGSADAGTAT